MSASLDGNEFDPRADLAVLNSIEGMHIGVLTENETRVFNQAVAEHRAYRKYEGWGGVLGLGKVALVRQTVT